MWLIQDKENKHKKFDQKSTKPVYLHNFGSFIKDIFIFTCSIKLKIIHNSLFLFSKFTYKVGQIKIDGKPQKLPF